MLCEILDCEPGELVRRTTTAAPAAKEPASGRTINTAQWARAAGATYADYVALRNAP